MRRTIAIVILLFAAGIPAAQADEPSPAARAADQVLEAVHAKNDSALAPFADGYDPDAWEVADLLLQRGEVEAAAALAKATTLVDFQRLAEYVAKQAKEKPAAAGAGLRAALAAAAKANAEGRAKEALEKLSEQEGPRGTVLAVLLAAQKAAALDSLGDSVKASKAHAALAAAAEEIGWLVQAANGWLHAGGDAYRSGAIEEALAHYQKSLAVFRERGATDGVAGLLFNVGLAHQILGHPDLALASLEEALKIRQGLEDKAGVAASLVAVGSLYGDLGDLTKAIDAHERGIAMMHDLGDLVQEGMTLSALGSLWLQRGDAAKAKDAADRALTIALEGKDARGHAWALTLLGRVHMALGDSAEALAVEREALGIFEATAHREGAGAALGFIAEVYISRGEFTEALAANGRALEIAEAIENVGMRGAGFAREGAIDRRLGDYRKALMLLKRSVQEYSGSKNNGGLAVVLVELGALKGQLGHYPEALADIEHAQRLYEEMGNRVGLAGALHAAGAVYFALGDVEKAIALETDALRRHEALGRRLEVSVALANLGTFEGARGNYPKATELLSQALAVLEELSDRAGIANALVNLAEVRIKSGKPAEALPLLDRAEALLQKMKDRAGTAYILVERAEAQRALKHTKDALALFDRAAREADRLSATDMLVQALVGTARTQLDRGESAGALETAKRAVTAAASLLGGQADDQGASSRSQFAGLYDVGALAAAAIEEPAQAAYFLETGRAGTLLESLGGRDALQSARLPEDLREADAKARAAESTAFRAYSDSLEKDDRALVKAKKADLDAARSARLAVAQRIQREQKADAGLLYPTVATVEEIEAGLKPEEALVVYGMTGDEVVALVATADQARVVRLGKGSDVQQACEAFRPWNAAEEWTEAADTLKGLLIAPLALGEKTKRLLISSDGVLSYVPFALLSGDRAIAYVPSGTAYAALTDERSKRGEGVLAIGDPAYPVKAPAAGAPPGALAEPADAKPGTLGEALERGGLKLVRLPGTRAEVKAIEGATLLLGGEATESGFREAIGKKPRWRAIHLACHGLVDPEKPSLSALAITPSAEDDGFLTALDVMGMTWPADLAVLSACETGKGKVVRGEGILGLTRAIFSAGPPRVIVSLWKVDDDATRALMTEFYKLWNPQTGSTRLGSAEALRQAQEFIRSHEKWKHPYYWAAWSLWGLPD